MRQVIRNFSMMAALSLMTTASALAAPWSSNANGVAPSGHFSWSNGVSSNGHFDNPVVTPDDRFVFSVGGFSANDTVVDANPAFVDELVEWDLQVNPGFQLTGMEVRMSGVYSVRGVGSYVELGGAFNVDENGGLLRNFNGPIVTTPESFPVLGTSTPVTQAYTSVATIDVSFEVPMVDDSVHISFYNFLEAFRAGNFGHTASINEQFQQFEIEIALIPEPATLALLAMGSIALLRRRR